MKNIAEHFSILQKTIKWLERGNKIHICIHDISGVLHSNPQLALDQANKVHNRTFCNLAKTTCTGLRFCLRCKACSIRKAIKQDIFYVGHCYLGITEIMKPVFWNDKPICIIYVGNILESNHLDFVHKKIQKACNITGVKKDLLFKSLDSVHWLATKEIPEYKEMIEIIEYQIKKELSSNAKISPGHAKIKPIISNSKHWIVEAVENYVHAYYNRDLKLSYLAKLYFVHPNYLCRLFKKETGKNFSEYVNRFRIEKAKEYLNISDDSTMDIAIQVGFNNVTYFNKLFLRYTGMSPRVSRGQGV